MDDDEAATRLAAALAPLLERHLPAVTIDQAGPALTTISEEPYGYTSVTDLRWMFEEDPSLDQLARLLAMAVDGLCTQVSETLREPFPPARDEPLQLSVELTAIDRPVVVITGFRTGVVWERWA